MTEPLRLLAWTCLALVIVLVVLSSYLRLDHSGIGCQPWPECYGNIGAPKAAAGVASTYDRLLEEARQPLSWATPLHRLVASLLGVLVLVMNMFAWLQGKRRLAAFAVLALTVFLAWLGIYSAGLHSPAVVMGNLCGGFLMLGLLGWMVLGPGTTRSHDCQKLRGLTMVAIVVLSMQIFLGGLTSAIFAAPACQTLPDCHGSWLPGAALADAFDLSRMHAVSESGRVLGGAERAEVHKLHRLFAILTAVAVLAAGLVAIRRGAAARIAAGIAIALVCSEIALGMFAILASLPIATAVAHNWLAALLLLALLRLAALSRNSSTVA